MVVAGSQGELAGVEKKARRGGAALFHPSRAGDRFIFRSKAAVDILVISMILEIWN
jgi:hypothetical protein